MPPYLASHLQKRRITHTEFTARLGLRHTASAWYRIASIWGSVYLLDFIRNPLVHLAEKFYFCSPLISG